MTRQILFFPFTHMTQNCLETMTMFFPEFVCMPPDYLNTARSKAVEYIEWAKIHKGNEHNLKALLKDSPYFTSDTHITTIKSQIKGGKQKSLRSLLTPEEKQASDLLFLTMAELYDEQNEQIDQKLNALDKNRDDLVSALRGLDHPLEKSAQSKPVASRDAGEVMTAERISSWSGCMASNGWFKQKDPPPFFVTTSPAVFDYLESNCSDVANALDIDQIKVHENKCKVKREWQHQFRECLMRAVQGEGVRETDLPEVSDNCLLFGQIKLNLFSGKLINTLLNVPDKQVAVCLVKRKQ